MKTAFHQRFRSPSALLLLIATGAWPLCGYSSEHVMQTWSGKIHVTVPALPPGWVFQSDKSKDTWLSFHKDGDGPDYDGLWCSFIVTTQANRYEKLDDYRRWHGAYEASAGSNAVQMEDSTLDGRRTFRFNAVIRRPPQQKQFRGGPYTEPGFYQIDDNSVVFGIYKKGPPQGEVEIIIRDTCTTWLKPEEAAWVENAYAEAKALRAGLRFRTEGTQAAPPASVNSPATEPHSGSLPWQVVVGIGAAGAIAIAGAAKIIAGTLSEKMPDTSSAPVGYVLQVCTSSLQLQIGQAQSLKIEVWAVDAKGGYRRAPTASIEVKPMGSLARYVSIRPSQGTGALTCEVLQTGTEPMEGELQITAHAPGAKAVSSSVHVACTGEVVMEFF